MVVNAEMSRDRGDATLGSILTLPKPETIHYAALAISVLAALAFMGCSIYYGRASMKA